MHKYAHLASPTSCGSIAGRLRASQDVPPGDRTSKISQWISHLPSDPGNALPEEAAVVPPSAFFKVPRRPAPAPPGQSVGKGRAAATATEAVALWYHGVKRELDQRLPIVLPKSRPKIVWDVFIMVFVLFSAVDVPLEISYGVPDVNGTFEYLNYGISFFFMCDIFLNFRTAYINAQGYLVNGMC